MKKFFTLLMLSILTVMNVNAADFALSASVLPQTIVRSVQPSAGQKSP